VQRGLMPDFGGAFRVMRALPANVARELLLTGRRLDAARAERLGFVNALAEPGGALEVALELADAISTGAPLAIRASLKVANAALNGDESALWQLSDAEHAALCRTDDVREGIQAFFDRRKPRWSGR
jgi:enoyl-CoA hydratase